MKPLVIKLGGAVLNNSLALDNLFAALQQVKQPIVLVHGGGVVVEDVLAKTGFVSEKLDGLRITPKEQIPYVVGALAGTSNKLLLAQALKAGLSAVGLCLSDAGSCKVSQMDARLGHVGEASLGNPALLNSLIELGHVPVMSSIGIGEDGELYNVNADQAALAVCKLLQGQLVLLSDVAGVLDQDKQLVAELNSALADKLIADGVITDGMTVKVKAALEAAEFLQTPVSLASWKDPAKLASLLAGQTYKGESVGTQVTV
ncbi:acetylglutamate kinase [Agarivorans sp. B2Z047]|uniref:acetylglutamate kinase n=1 Tax=Agarivorans sp. B2Z047 TaxID=2652721 RepID=UPI00128B2A6F|nr:acetylglutamate kinase [Agarivorans sp. B2Z047]MPW30022.1 acetylglutamate kinase [Agarivorans sp. B2Z047]UQN43591.1 acetylglutamate kinase [Agarivorans sp. B2Z047]